MDENTKLVLDLLKGINALDTTVTGDALAENGAWDIPADPERLSIGGRMDRSAFLNLIESLRAYIPDGFTIVPIGLTSQGERVAVEADGSCVTNDGYVFAHLAPQIAAQQANS